MIKLAAVFFLCFLIMTGLTAMARETTLSGGGSVGYEMYQKSSTASTDSLPVEAASVTDDDYSRLSLSPRLKITNVGSRSTLTAEYTSTFLYDDDGEDDLQQALELSAKWLLGSRWQLYLAGTYAETDSSRDSATQAGATLPAMGIDRLSRTQLTEVAGRQQYITTQMRADTSYQYREDSSLRFGYLLDQLRNDDEADSYQDYDKHTLFAAAEHHFSTQYLAHLTVSYVAGEYDQASAVPSVPSETALQSRDVEELHINTVLESLEIPHHPLSVEYDLAVSAFADELARDTLIHRLLLGWAWESSEQLRLFFGAGPTLTQVDGQGDSWDYTMRSSLSYTLEKSSFMLLLERGQEVRNFTGTGDNGLTEYWLGSAAFSHKLQENLVFSVTAIVTDEKIDQESLLVAAVQPGQSASKQRYTISSGLAYTFWQWYSLQLLYAYSTQDADVAADDYDEHRLTLTLSMQRDFFRW